MYRAKAITQRDGSKLANSNCRMASIACGLDFDTLGRKKSTGGTMRTFTADQLGGTDSGDAREAWSKGYQETLTVRDGNGWGQVLVDLKAGRLVHLDVWHANLAGAGVCVSGEGRYGHTVAVAPEQHTDGRWLVSDPWCLPAKWVWVSEKTLRLAAEEWGSRVFNNATRGRRTPLPPLGSGELGLILAAMARQLMTQFYPENEATPSAIPSGDTGGPPPVLFTVTMAHPDQEVDVAGLRVNITERYNGTATVVGANHSSIQLADGDMNAVAAGLVRQVYAKAVFAEDWSTPGGTKIAAGTRCVLIGQETAVLLEQDVTLKAAAAPAPAEEYVPAGELYVKKG